MSEYDLCACSQRNSETVSGDASRIVPWVSSADPACGVYSSPASKRSPGTWRRIYFRRLLLHIAKIERRIASPDGAQDESSHAAHGFSTFASFCVATVRSRSI